MSDDPGFFQQIAQSWEAMAATLSASIASAWGMIKANGRRLDRLEQKIDTLEEKKASKDDVRDAIHDIHQTSDRIYTRLDDLYKLYSSQHQSVINKKPP